MPKTVTLRLSDEDYALFRSCAAADNRAIANLIETAARRHLQEASLMNPAEERAIMADKALVRGLRIARRQGAKRQGRIVA